MWLIRTVAPNTDEITNYFELSYDDFLLELKKNKVNITSRETQELVESEFNKSVNIIHSLQKDAQELEAEINKLVYELYGLTSDEISIIENSFKE